MKKLKYTVLAKSLEQSLMDIQNKATPFLRTVLYFELIPVIKFHDLNSCKVQIASE